MTDGCGECLASVTVVVEDLVSISPTHIYGPESLAVKNIEISLSSQKLTEVTLTEQWTPW